MNKRGVHRQMLIASGETDQKRTRDTRAVKYLSQSPLHAIKYVLQSLPLQMNISEGCTGEDYTNRGCRSCFQKQLVVRGGAHVPSIHCNSKPGVN